MKHKNCFRFFKKLSKGFTLIEMILSVTLFSIIVLIWFDSLSSISIFKTKISYKLDLNQDLYNSIENIVSVIKDFWWDIDYEEYWNRSAVWTQLWSWHYSKLTWFWNYWSWWSIWLADYWYWFYFCRSWSWETNVMWTWWCLEKFNHHWDDVSFSWKYQRYWQYAFQFIDYNANKNNEEVTWICISSNHWWLWDEDCNWNIRWDDDDEDLWLWPVAFTWNEVKELYLIKKWDTTERIFLRLNITQDPDVSGDCDFINWTGTGCLGNIQILKLVWYDNWLNHDNSGYWTADGIIDTWKCHNDFNCNTDEIPTWNDSEWVNLLPDYINVKDFKIFIYPNKDFKYAWKDYNENYRINSYIRLNMILWFSHIKRKQIKWISPEMNISTTINLNNF